MMTMQQLRSVGAVRRTSAMRFALPLAPGAPRRLAPQAPVPAASNITTRADDNGGNGGYDNTEVQEKFDELQAKVQKWWDEIDDKGTFLLYVGVAVFGLTVANQFLRAVDSIPALPNLLKLVGLVYSSWFTYKYLLFAEGREQLGKDFDKLKDGIAGSVKKSSSSAKVDRNVQDAVSSLKTKVADTTSDLSAFRK